MAHLDSLIHESTVARMAGRPSSVCYLQCDTIPRSIDGHHIRVNSHYIRGSIQHNARTLKM